METSVKEREQKLFKALTYEVVGEKRIFYRGYKDVLEGKKQPEEIMASGKLQAFIVAEIIMKIGVLRDKGFVIVANEHGVKTPKGYRAVDIGIFEKNKFKLSEGYSDVAPLVAIEVDVKAELENMTFMEYVGEKVKDLFDIGTQRVIWILTKPRIVMVFERGKEGRILTWEDEVEVLEGLRFRLSDLIQP
ncbi:MAG: Uma2 family endonuclease [candidate division WOR-3 bacterium]